MDYLPTPSPHDRIDRPSYIDGSAVFAGQIIVADFRRSKKGDLWGSICMEVRGSTVDCVAWPYVGNRLDKSQFRPGAEILILGRVEEFSERSAVAVEAIQFAQGPQFLSA